MTKQDPHYFRRARIVNEEKVNTIRSYIIRRAQPEALGLRRITNRTLSFQSLKAKYSDRLDASEILRIYYIYEIYVSLKWFPEVPTHFGTLIGCANVLPLSQQGFPSFFWRLDDSLFFLPAFPEMCLSRYSLHYAI